MQCVILVAGYATRLYPLTINRPKALLPVQGRPILAHLLEKVTSIADIGRIILVSNHRFADVFRDWVQQSSFPQIEVVDDRTTTNETRLGAIGDLKLALEVYGICDDALVLAGDNLFLFSLQDFCQFAKDRQTDCITTYQQQDVTKLRQTGVIELGEGDRVLSFCEKPPEPTSPWAVPPFYYYRQDTLPLVAQYLQEGNNPDAPGNFIPWLLQHRPVYAYRISGTVYDVGTPESYREVQQLNLGNPPG